MASNPKIDDFRARLKAEPKGRHFFPLAEELRKAGSLSEAEQTLRDGLTIHPNYLSAWVSLGRVLRDGGKHAEAIDALQRALALDANNAVTARLMAETYLTMGEKVEAIKKFKLVNALVPDPELQEQIEALDLELNGPVVPAQQPPLAEAPEVVVEPEVAGEVEEIESAPIDVDDSPLDEAAALLAHDAAVPLDPVMPPPDEAAFEVARDEPFDEPSSPAAIEEAAADEVDPFDEPDALLQSTQEPSPFDESSTSRTGVPTRLGTVEEPFGVDEESEAEVTSSGNEEDPFSGEIASEPVEDRAFAEPDSIANEVESSDEPAQSSSFSSSGGDEGRTQVVVQRLEQWLAKVKR